MDLLDYGSSDGEDDGGKREQKPPQRSKVLKLASILPQHILDRLTKGSNNGDTDSSDEGSVTGPKSSKRKETTASTTRVSSLLNDLADMKPKNSSLLLQRFPFDRGIVIDGTTTPEEEAEVRTDYQGSLGEAFLRPKITVEKKSNGVAVRDIHAEPSEPDEPEPDEPEPDEPAAPAKPEPKRADVLLGTKLQRPVIQAAPPVRSMMDPESIVQKMGISETSLPATTKSTVDINTKKSQQHLERELRRGNVGAVKGIAVDGVKPTDHTPNVIDYEAMSTIRNVPTTMYDPGSGQVKQAKVSKAKNQIHFLVHQAAELERRRAEEGPARPSRRADAKRKYGF
jgi:hypothetical protein